MTIYQYCLYRNNYNDVISTLFTLYINIMTIYQHCLHCNNYNDDISARQ